MPNSYIKQPDKVQCLLIHENDSFWNNPHPAAFEPILPLSRDSLFEQAESAVSFDSCKLVINQPPTVDCHYCVRSRPDATSANGDLMERPAEIAQRNTSLEDRALRGCCLIGSFGAVNSKSPEREAYECSDRSSICRSGKYLRSQKQVIASATVMASIARQLRQAV